MTMTMTLTINDFYHGDTGGSSDQAQLAEFPHMCVLFRMEGRQRVYVGGASLIARNKVNRLMVANIVAM